MDLALEFDISKEEASDLAKNGDGQIEIFRIWLKKGPQTWKELLNLLHKLNEHKLAVELQDKLERKGIALISMQASVIIVQDKVNL